MVLRNTYNLLRNNNNSTIARYCDLSTNGKTVLCIKYYQKYRSCCQRKQNPLTRFKYNVLCITYYVSTWIFNGSPHITKIYWCSSYLYYLIRNTWVKNRIRFSLQIEKVIRNTYNLQQNKGTASNIRASTINIERISIM